MTNAEPAVTRNVSVTEPDTHTLLADCRRFLKAVEKLFQVLPERMRAGHLSGWAKRLIAEIDQILVPAANTEQERASDDG